MSTVSEYGLLVVGVGSETLLKTLPESDHHNCLWLHYHGMCGFFFQILIAEVVHSFWYHDLRIGTLFLASSFNKCDIFFVVMISEVLLLFCSNYIISARALACTELKFIKVICGF